MKIDVTRPIPVRVLLVFATIVTVLVSMEMVLWWRFEPRPPFSAALEVQE